MFNYFLFRTILVVAIFILTNKYFNNTKASIFITIGFVIILESSNTLCAIENKLLVENFDPLKTEQDRKDFCDMMNKVRNGCQNPSNSSLTSLCKNYNSSIENANKYMLKILNVVQK